MGTYRQPSRVIDKSLNTLNQGMQDVNQVMVDGLKRIRAEEIARAKEAKKEQEKRDKERKAFEAKRNAAVDGYRVKIDNWEHINQKRAEDWQTEDVAIDNQLKNNALYYLDIMSNSTEGDDNYRTSKRAIENMIIQYPVMAQLLNDESEELGEAFYENGAHQRKATEANALLLSDDPLYNTKKNMLYDIKYDRNPENFQVLFGPSGFNIKYNDKDGKEFTLNANDYQQYKEGGNDLIGSTNEENYNTFMDATWGIVGQDYKGIESVVTKYKKDIASGNPVEYREVVESYNKANEGVEENIEAWVNRGGTVTQSQWQLLGNETIYNPTMKKELADQLYNAQIERYGKDDKYKLSEEEIIKGGGSGSGSGTSSSDFKRLDENKKIIQDIVEVVKESKNQKEGLPKDALKVKAVDMYRQALGNIDSKSGSTYVTGAEISEDIANEIIRDKEEEGKKLTDVEKDSLRQDILEDKMLTIYSKKGSGKWSEYPFDLENPRGMFEKLSLTIPGLTPKDIGDYGFTLGEVNSSSSTDPTKGMTEEEKIKFYLANSKQ